MRRIGWAALAVGFVLGGGSNAEAAIIDLSGIITDATLTSGVTGSLTPTFPTDTFQAAIDIENSAIASFSITLPEIDFSFANCGQPNSSCGNSVPMGTRVAKPDGSSYFIQQYKNYGPFSTFDVYMPSFGDAKGYFKNDGSKGQIDIDLFIVAVARADSSGRLQAQLLVAPVPLPASLPMFGGALLALGALAYRKRLRDAL